MKAMLKEKKVCFWLHHIRTSAARVMELPEPRGQDWNKTRNCFKSKINAISKQHASVHRKSSPFCSHHVSVTLHGCFWSGKLWRQSSSKRWAIPLCKQLCKPRRNCTKSALPQYVQPAPLFIPHVHLRGAESFIYRQLHMVRSRVQSAQFYKGLPLLHISTSKYFCKHYREIIWGMEIKEHHIETESNVLFTLMVEPELKSPYIFETTWSHNSVSFSYIPSYLLPASDRHSPLPFPPISPPMAEDDLLLNSFHHSCDMEIPHSSCCITPSQHSNCSPNSAKMQGKKKKKVKICIKDNCSKFAMSVCRASTFVKQRMKDPWSGLVSDGEIIAVPASKCRVKDKSQNDCDEISFSQICKVLLLWRCSQKAAQCIRLYSALM